MNLQGKAALVTGANHGIGAAIAKALASEGAAVVVHYLRLPSDASDDYSRARNQSADQVVREIGESGGQAIACEADLSDVTHIPRLFDAADAAFGGVSVLVNNAAHWEADTFVLAGLEAHGADEWPPRSLNITAQVHDQHFAVNSRAVALMMAEFARRHVARGAGWGRIVNVSTSGAECFPGEVSYGASKAALESYSRSAAKELGRYGITVNIVAPGPIQTGWITPEFVEQIAKNTPLGRVGTPEDVADVVAFLASDEARWVTGQLLYVGGGQMV